MSRITFILLLLASTAASAQPLMESTNFISVDFDGDGVAEASHRASVFIADNGGSLQYSVVEYVVARFGVVVLRESAAALYFRPGTAVEEGSPPNGTPPLTTSAGLVDYGANLNRFFEWQYFDQMLVDSSRDQLSVLVGIRFPVEGGMCHGWLKFVRPSAELPTLFTLDSYDWNPIPGAPIRAGLPPEIPILSEWLPDGETLRFTWPPALTSWVLESTPSLLPPVVWEPVESGGGYADVRTTDPGRFFRLRRP